MNIVERFKFKIRKNKLLKSVLRIPYVAFFYIKSYPEAIEMKNGIINILDNISNSNKKVYYFCEAEHPNLGDLAQRYCIENWLEEYYPEYEVVQIASLAMLRFKNKILSSIANSITKDDIFVFQSGYTMTDTHQDDKVRRIVLDVFNSQRTIIFPQTILFKDRKLIEERKRIFEKCDKLLLLLRDEISYEYAKKYFPNTNIKLYPDIVTSLIGMKSFDIENRSGIGLCMRNDGEKYYSYEEILNLKQKLELIDFVDVTDTNCSSSIKINRESIYSTVWGKIEDFSRKKVIVTDRYHGTIFSLVAGTPVIVIKTNDHKVSTGVKWLKGIYDNYAYYCENIKDVPMLVSKIYSENRDNKLRAYFKHEYYDKLKECLEEITDGNL